MRLFAYRIYQIPCKNKAKHAANFEVVAAQSIRKTRYYGATQR